MSFTGGYPFNPGGTVTLDIGGSKFNLGPGQGDAGEWAWTDPSDDSRAVAAMRRGSTATLTGVAKQLARTSSSLPRTARTSLPPRIAIIPTVVRTPASL